MKLDSYLKDIAATATPENLVADSGKQWKFAREVWVGCPAGNTSDIQLGSRDRQALTVVKGTVQRLTAVLKGGAGQRYNLEEIFVSVGSNGDDVEIMVIDPSES